MGGLKYVGSSPSMLRASCDRCHRDKVKCQFDLNESACVRCQHRKSRCVRSPAMPSGRVRKGTSAKTKATAARNPDPSGDLLKLRVQVGAGSGLGAEKAAETTAPGRAAAAQEAEFGFLPSPPAGYHHNTQSPCGLESLGSGGRGDEAAGDCWWDLPPPCGAEPASAGPVSSWPWYYDDGHAQLPLLPAAGSHSSSDGSTPTFPSERSSPRATRCNSNTAEAGPDDAVAPCHCCATLTRFLDHDSHESHPCLSSDPLAFDKVLNTNSAVIGAVRDMGDCAGRHPPSLLMTACLLIQSVLASLHEAWWLSCRPGQAAQPVPAAGARGGQRVFIGSCQMSEEDSAVLRRQMILLDLDKVKRALAQLQSRMRNDQDADLDGVYSFLSKFLGAEVRRILRRISEQAAA